MMSREEMRRLVGQIDGQLTTIYKKECHGAGVDRSILLPPATPREIASFEKKVGVRFPPSYREFLQLHNGWEHFRFDMTLTGVSGKHTDRVLAEVKETTEWQVDKLTSKLGAVTPATIAAWEKEDPSHLFLPNHVCFATSFAGEFFVFDRRTVRPDGETEVVFWNIGSGADDDERYDSFAGLLEATARRVETHYNKLTKSKAKKKK